jgi:hypothetical protein
MIVGVLDESRILTLGFEIHRLPRFVHTPNTDHGVAWDKTKNLRNGKTIFPVVHEVAMLRLDHRIGHDL